MTKSLKYICKIIISISISFLILGFMFQLFTKGMDAASRPQLLIVLKNSLLIFIGIRICFYFLQTFFRAVRYRLLIKAAGSKSIPDLFHISLVTIVRNMTVDMLPARLGELSYIAMLNRGYGVPSNICFSSLSISFVFDILALLFIIIPIIIYQLITTTVHGWLINAVIAIVFISILLFVFLFFGFKNFTQILIKRKGVIFENKFAKKIILFLSDFSLAIEKTRQSGCLLKTLILSIGVRIAKYAGIYFLFLAVVKPSFPQFASAGIVSVISALLGAEGASALPIPAFMSFGTYEAGGTLVFKLLGFKNIESLITMISIHIWSQLSDYLFGGIALIFFLFLNKIKLTETKTKLNLKLVAVVLTLLCVGFLFMAIQYRAKTKMGAMSPPEKGVKVSPSINENQAQIKLKDKNLSGFIVWSSNRFGNHDILMMKLPSFEIIQVTKHPYVDYFPRISPDGSKVVFARSQHPWVSQRNEVAWDIYLINLTTGNEQLLTKNGNCPSWSENNRYIYFQRNRTKVIKYDLKTKKQKILFKSGTKGLINKNTQLSIPSYSTKRNSLVFTTAQTYIDLHTGGWGTAILKEMNKLYPVYNGCEIAWTPDSSYLYQVSHGRQGTAFYKINPETLKLAKWLDLPGDYSHEYFPKVSNNMKYLIFGSSTGAHEHDIADYEIFLWEIGQPAKEAIRLTFHTGNDCWPDIYLN